MHDTLVRQDGGTIRLETPEQRKAMHLRSDQLWRDDKFLQPVMHSR